MLQELSGKVAVVTGAGSGIGAALCRRMGAEGMTVVAADIESGAARATADAIGGHAVDVDVSDPASVQALADEAFRSARSTCCATTPGSSRAAGRGSRRWTIGTGRWASI